MKTEIVLDYYFFHSALFIKSKKTCIKKEYTTLNLEELSVSVSL